MSKLSLQTSSKPAQRVGTLADSWEDEDVSSGSETEKEIPATAAVGEADGTEAPPPTPLSPFFDAPRPFSSMPDAVPGVGYKSFRSVPAAGAGGQRPEKTDAVARRMIAGALGVRVRPTEEQKAYDKAVREKEMKKRTEEREARRKQEEEALKAKQAVWND